MAIKLLTEAEILKKYKGTANKASIMIEENNQILRIPSRCIWMNHQTGGGLVYGTITEGFGYESTGKTLMALDYAYVTQQLGGMVGIIDAEQAFNMPWAEKNGLDPTKTYLYDSNDLEGSVDWVRDMGIYFRSILTNNEPILFIIDSLDAWEIADELDADMKNPKASYGMAKAKKINQLFRKRINFFKRYGIHVYIINQVRTKIGASMFEAAEKTPGGDAVRFYASLRQAFIRSKQIKIKKTAKGGWVEAKKPGEGKKVGQHIYSEIVKNKTAPPRAKVKSSVYFTPELRGYIGFDRYEGLLDILLELGIVKHKKGVGLEYKDSIILKTNKDEAPSKFSNLLHEDEGLRRKLIKKAGINTISKTREQLEAIGKNLYPVKLKKSQEEEAEDE